LEDNNEITAALYELFSNAEKMYGDALENYWFYESEICPCCNKNKIDPKKIAFLRPDELNPAKYKQIIDKEKLEEINIKNQSTSSVFKCPKCKARKVQIIQKQTRSSDEPATDFIECKECGHVEVRNN
jgi:DNA-directed RNA polymerase subunit M/transcription elongation factor TFIIS